MTWEQTILEERENAKAEGKKAQTEKIALSLLADGMAYETVSKHTGLSLAEITALAGEKTA